MQLTLRHAKATWSAGLAVSLGLRARADARTFFPVAHCQHGPEHQSQAGRGQQRRVTRAALVWDDGVSECVLLLAVITGHNIFHPSLNNTHTHPSSPASHHTNHVHLLHTSPSPSLLPPLHRPHLHQSPAGRARACPAQRYHIPSLPAPTVRTHCPHPPCMMAQPEAAEAVAAAAATWNPTWPAPEQAEQVVANRSLASTAVDRPEHRCVA